MKKIVSLLFSVLLFSLASAQVTTSSFSGRVTDAAGAPLVGAAVIAVHTPSGTEYGTVTDAKGNFRIMNVRPGGPYTVTFRLLGYKTFAEKDIRVPLGDNYVLRPSLPEETTNIDAVQVSWGKNPIMNADRSGTATNVNSRQLATLPSITRSINDFTRLSPQAGHDNSFAGRDGRYNNITVDGAAFNNSFGLSTANNMPGGDSQPISLDAIQEVTVNVSPFDVRQSGFTGAGVNAVTRSGDNDYQGSVYTYFRPRSFTGENVRGEVVPGAKTTMYKTVGMRAGGPIVRNKLFFFVNGEVGSEATQGIRWRPSQKNTAGPGQGDAGSYVSRTSTYDLERVKNHLLSTYGYDPGSYTDFPNFAVDDYRIMARLDWNIDDRNQLMVRYNMVNSVSDQTASGSMPTGLGSSASRYSVNAFNFSNANYGFLNRVHSLTGEWNSQFSSRVSNKLLVTWMNNKSVRTSPSAEFPFVDILEGGTQYMSFGYELFSYNNGVTNKSFTVTDNVTVALGDHALTAGASFERQYFLNSYIREGLSYYRYNSVDDFLNDARPAAFALTYPFAGEDAIRGTELTFGMASAYVQDEWQINPRFRLTAGLRFEMPFCFNELGKDTQIEGVGYVRDLAFDRGEKYDLGTWPKSRLMVSPRIGFNWDVKGDRSWQVRGGTGIFTGFVPFVWYTNQPQGAGYIQAAETAWNSAAVPDDMRFEPDYRKQLSKYSSLLPNDRRGVIGRGGSLSKVADDFRLPQVWRTTVATDIQLPWNTVLTVEAIYSKDINAVMMRNANLSSQTYGHFTGPDNRPVWWQGNGNWIDGGDAPSQARRTVQPSVNSMTVMENTRLGRQFLATVQLTKSFSNGFSGMVSYTYNNSRDVGVNAGSNGNSAWRSNVAVNNLNYPGLSYSMFSVPHRVNGYVSYAIQYAKKHLSTTVSLYYTGSHTARLSYIYSNDLNGDGQACDLIYVPRDASEIRFVDVVKDGRVTYSAQDQADDFFAYVEGNGYLKKRKGQYAERGGALAPWLNRFDVKIVQDIAARFGTGKRYTLQLTADILNVGNLLCSDWGIYYANGLRDYDNIMPLTYRGVDASKTPTFTLNASDRESFRKKAGWNGQLSTSSTWGCQLGVRLIF